MLRRIRCGFYYIVYETEYNQAWEVKRALIARSADLCYTQAYGDSNDYTSNQEQHHVGTFGFQPVQPSRDLGNIGVSYRIPRSVHARAGLNLGTDLRHFGMRDARLLYRFDGLAGAHH